MIRQQTHARSQLANQAERDLDSMGFTATVVIAACLIVLAYFIAGMAGWPE